MYSDWLKAWTIGVLLTVGAAACGEKATEPGAGGAEAPANLSQGAGADRTGWFHTLTGDPRNGRGNPRAIHELVDDRGTSTQLVIDPSLLGQHAGGRALDRKRVRVSGAPLADGRFRVTGVQAESGTMPTAGTEQPVVRAGAFPYVTILCKFADAPAFEPRQAGTYLTWMTSASAPYLDHYWREQSFGQMNTSGSTAVGWFTLPQPRSYYVPAGGSANLTALTEDCTHAADAAVSFPSYYGINMQFNGNLDGYNYGGTYTLTLDGQTKFYGVTWMADWADISVYAHEEGHSLGLPHSSGPYGQVYDSRWDVMSNAYPFYDHTLGSYTPQNTISYHKDLLGWIAPTRKTTVALNTSQTITLERLAQAGTGNYLKAEIPIDNAGRFYTVEARRLVGNYDSHLPGDAVVIHRVVPWLSEPAHVVDVDNNGDPNDAGAMWTAGETFTDATNKISVQVTAMTATGFQVTITHGAVTTSRWAAKAAMPTARKQFAAGVANNVVYAIGGANAAGTLLTKVEAYNPSTNTWVTKAPLPAARWRTNGAAAVNGVLYVAGGVGAGTPGHTKTLYAYNTTTNTWSTKAPMPVAGGCGASWAISGIVYVLVGCDPTTASTSGAKGILLRYNPATNAWSTRAAAPGAHQFPGMAGIGGKLYVVGGKNASGAASAALHVYDPATNAWTTKAPLPAARHNLTAWPIGGKLYAVGGNDAAGAFTNTVYVYDPATNVWGTVSSAMPTARAALGAAAASGVLYALGGYNAAAAALGTNEAFTP